MKCPINILHTSKHAHPWSVNCSDPVWTIIELGDGVRIGFCAKHTVHAQRVSEGIRLLRNLTSQKENQE